MSVKNFKTPTPKKSASSLSRFFGFFFVGIKQKFREESVEDRAATPLELCYHRRAQDRPGSFPRVIGKSWLIAEGAVDFLALFIDFTRVIATRSPTKSAR